MDTQLIENKFTAMGARVRINFVPESNGLAVNVEKDRDGELFTLRANAQRVAELLVLDVQKDRRHLLLMSKSVEGQKRKFLCGHDERHWFVAAVPERAGAFNVRSACEALKPRMVRLVEARLSVPFEHRLRRHNAASIRQGEWFFVPVGDRLRVPDWRIRRNEPLRRTGGKPHFAEFCYRFGGEIVYVDSHGRVISRERWSQIAREQPTAADRYTQQRANMAVYVRGRIRHADHATLHLKSWHQVFMNTEHESEAMRYVRFID